MTTNRKDRLARMMQRTGFSKVGIKAQALLVAPTVRVVNYHGVPPQLAEQFERQLQRYADAFTPVDPDQLRAFQAGEWRPKRQGLILTFDDGVRSHAETVAPLLEKYGHVGWFMLVSDFIDQPPHLQREFVRSNTIAADAMHYDDGRYAMTWDDARRLASMHVVGCHTRQHRRLGESLTSDELSREITMAKGELELRLGAPVTSFAWVGGEEHSYSAAAAEVIRAAGFEFSLLTNSGLLRPGFEKLQITRTNIEARFEPDLVEFQISGAMDIVHWPVRRRVRAKTTLG